MWVCYATKKSKLKIVFYFIVYINFTFKTTKTACKIL